MTPEVSAHYVQHEAVTSAVRKDLDDTGGAKLDAVAVLFANESVVHESKIFEALLRRCERHHGRRGSGLAKSSRFVQHGCHGFLLALSLYVLNPLVSDRNAF